ncbi:NUDIX domain-containing protein [Aneurinibacillus migulanus]|uniref:NUDIX domain-containing protein n=1 Tax=Aneurinibacillus migulanus TaxID=47500 RepID=UPI002E1F6DA5|nr:NUDIX domain-containing protein [Aneurinibacillus migulanus]MED4730742.1 NUDIX domain-containing protein [Aneurinibacillus migulanus]
MKVRTSAKALIVQNNKVLLIKMRDDRGIYYIMPGGGQEHGETLPQTLRRECLEELGMDVHIGSLLFVREYIGKNHENALLHNDIHQVEFIFSCRPASLPSAPAEPDNGQIGSGWLDIANLSNYRLYPKQLLSVLENKWHTLENKNGEDFPAYVGDMN